MRISFHGAAGGVTGSCHLLETGSARLLVDCGLFQGSRELREENGRDFGFDPASIDFLLLTHAHLDHCGRIPLLVKQGFQGKVVCTAATKELTRLVLAGHGAAPGGGRGAGEAPSGAAGTATATCRRSPSTTAWMWKPPWSGSP